MKVTSIQVADSDRKDYVRLSALIQYDDGIEETVWFDFPEIYKSELSLTGNPWLVLMLPLAMQTGEALIINAPVDPHLLWNLQELQDIWKCWYPQLNFVEVTPKNLLPEAEQCQRKAASFFSGGVDSFYSALKHRSATGNISKVDDLIFVWGFDIAISQIDVGTRLTMELMATAQELRMNLLPVATNVRTTRWAKTNWPLHSHGAALGAVGLCLERRYTQVLIPSTESYNQLYPWGSHTLTDPLFSTSSLRIHHDGAECSRLGKIRLLAKSPIAMKSLRVCWRSEDGINCCKCQKCIRTMLELEVIDSLRDCSAFSQNTTDLAILRKVFIEWDLVPDYQEIYAHAKVLGYRDISLSLKYAFARTKLIELGLKLIRIIKRLPGGSKVAEPIRRALHSSSVH